MAATSRTLRRRVTAAVCALLAALTCVLALGVAPVAAQTETTSTLPVDNRQLGDMIPKPNTGMEPQSPGDPGGWLQVSLFFLICAAIVVIGLAVWWTSRRARQRRSEAGLDPVDLARARGAGVRGAGVRGAGSGETP
jgi:hypothetical protein